MPLQPHPPARTPLAEALVASIIVLLVGLCAWLANAPFLAPPLGVTALLCAREPGAVTTTARSIVGGHILGLLCGLGAALVCGATQLPNALSGPFELSHALASALALGGTALASGWLRCPHPPAAATTLVVSLGLLRGAPDLAAFLAGVALTALCARLLGALRASTGSSRGSA